MDIYRIKRKSILTYYLVGRIIETGVLRCYQRLLNFILLEAMEKQFKTIQKVFWRVPDSNIKKPGDKNLIFCTQCGRSKLQFKSLKSAYNHIKWNSNEIYRENGKAPVRAYWCDDCCCYHVTSKVNSTKYEETEKSRLLDYIKEALTTDNISESRKYIQNAYKIISE